jgi:hypothetical protein
MSSPAPLATSKVTNFSQRSEGVAGILPVAGWKPAVPRRRGADASSALSATSKIWNFSQRSDGVAGILAVGGGGPAVPGSANELQTPDSKLQTGHSPSFGQIASIRFFTSADISISSGQTRLNPSPGSFFVPSIPTWLPYPNAREA